jgi:hypothetical protein
VVQQPVQVTDTTDIQETDTLTKVAVTHPNPQRIRAKGAPPRKKKVVPRRVEAPKTSIPEDNLGNQSAN